MTTPQESTDATRRLGQFVANVLAFFINDEDRRSILTHGLQLTADDAEEMVELLHEAIPDLAAEDNLIALGR